MAAEDPERTRVTTTETEGSDEGPPTAALVLSIVAFGALFALGFSPRHALYWYIFPLFGIGAVYLIQFRHRISRYWTIVFACSAVVSPLALALSWPFSGHILWLVLFLGHAYRLHGRWSRWTTILSVALVYQIIMKLVIGTTSDILGALGSAVIAVLVVWRSGRRDVSD